MLPDLSLSSTLYPILSLVVFFVLYVSFRFFLNPYLKMLYYRKQGGWMFFYPQMNNFDTLDKEATETGDYFHRYKTVLKEHPETKFFVENLASEVQLVIADIQMGKYIMNNYEIFQKEKYYMSIFHEVSKGTTILAEGAEWKKGRKILSTILHFEFLKQIIPVIIDTIQEKFTNWIENDDLVDTDLLEKLASITGEITGKLFFGKKFAEKKVRGITMTAMAQKLAVDVMTESMSPGFTLFGPKFTKLNLLPRQKELNKDLKAFRDKCEEIIKETEVSEKRETDLLQSLLDLRKTDKENSKSDEDIIGEFMGLFNAGTDTTSHLVNAALYFLWKDPEVLRKVNEEVERELTDLNSVDMETLKRMEYTGGMLKEALRFGGGPSGSFFPRVAVKDEEVCGIKIKKGTLVNYCDAFYYEDERFYSNPKEFRPERWIENDPLKSEPYAFIPFSAGPRKCIGQNLAMIEAKLMIGLFLKTFKFSFPADYKYILTLRFTMEPQDPLRITMKPIKN